MPAGRLTAFLVRALLPSWRFFDQVEPAPKLAYRVGPGQRELGEWQPVVFGSPRALGSLWLNPAGNLALAEHALLERLLGELAEPELSTASQVQALTTYQLVLRLVRARLAEGARAQVEGLFQFKLSLAEPPSYLPEDVLVSGLHEL